MNKYSLGFILFAYSIVGQCGDLPNAKMTTGALNLQVTQENIHETVCVKGFTKTIRPPANYTNKLKRQQIEQYGYGDSNPKHYEEDHLVPLSIGGHPTDPRNLWPQPRESEWGADRKDNLEFALYMGVCRNKIKLADAQQAMTGNWILAYKHYEKLLGKYKRYGSE